MRECSACGIASAMHEDYCTAQTEASKAKQEAVTMLQEMKSWLMKVLSYKKFNLYLESKYTPN